uniref:Baseplate assembly protein n=1 Tax=Desulfacinum infernum TaxID=35837 RepID=A0A832A844_9BACT
MPGIPSHLPPEPIGWPLLPVPDADGRLRYPSLEESVRQSIRIVLLTQPGELLMRPTFGAGLSRYVHEPNTLSTRRRIHDAVLEALEKWEPRILVDHVLVEAVADKPDRIRVEIVYRLRRTNRPARTALTMTLES